MAEVPASIRDLLRDRIETYESLELVLMLRKNGGAWSSETSLANALGIPTSAVREELMMLCERELVEPREGGAHEVRYAPRTPALDDDVRTLAALYDEDRLAIVQIMNENAIRRVRTFAARTFADAFLIRKKKNG